MTTIAIICAFLFHVFLHSAAWYGAIRSFCAKPSDYQSSLRFVVNVMFVVSAIVFSFICITPAEYALIPTISAPILTGFSMEMFKKSFQQEGERTGDARRVHDEACRSVHDSQNECASVAQKRAEQIFQRIPQSVRNNPMWNETMTHLRCLINLIPNLEHEISRCTCDFESLKQTIIDLRIGTEGSRELNPHEITILKRHKDLQKHIDHLQECERELELVVGEAHAESLFEGQCERVHKLEETCRKLIEGIGQGSRLRTLVRKELGGDSSVVEIDLQVEWSAFCDESEPKACSGRALGTCSHDAVREAFERRRLAQAAKQKVQSF